MLTLFAESVVVVHFCIQTMDVTSRIRNQLGTLDDAPVAVVNIIAAIL
ncbi:hypothetical protein C5167_007403 [Papaver somniferum]|nr:hypothetical protein C5167_007403 [Papaver somniferum]